MKASLETRWVLAPLLSAVLSGQEVHATRTIASLSDADLAILLFSVERLRDMVIDEMGVRLRGHELGYRAHG